MMKFSGSILYSFENLPFLSDDRSYYVSGVAEVTYNGEAQLLLSKNYMGSLNCEIDGFVELYAEDEHGKAPDVMTPEMLNELADTLAQVHADGLIDKCAEDSMKWLKSDDNH